MCFKTIETVHDTSESSTYWIEIKQWWEIFLLPSWNILRDNSFYLCTEVRTSMVASSRTIFLVHGLRWESEEAQIRIEEVPRENKKCHWRGITIAFRSYGIRVPLRPVCCFICGCEYLIGDNPASQSKCLLRLVFNRNCSLKYRDWINILTAVYSIYKILLCCWILLKFQL